MMAFPRKPALDTVRLLVAWTTLMLPATALDAPHERLLLKEGWAVQSSANVAEPGDVLSRTGYAVSTWYPTSVPATVLAALIENKVYPDPYFDMNLRSIPGTTYPIGEDFSNLRMPPTSPFRVSWWYRTEFELPASFRGRTIWLRFGGINYRANVWLNGQRIADSSRIAGTYRVHELDITATAVAGGANALAVEVFAPLHNDLAFTWVDWNPMPPDKDMGLWHEVSVAASGPVTVRHPFVATQLETPSLDTAHLTVTAELRNASRQAVTGTLRGRIEGIEFSRDVTLAPLESRAVSFDPAEFPQLTLERPRLWWPAQLGPQSLYELDVAFERGGEVSDRQTIRFGVRQVTSELTEEGHLLFKINGKRILIRGGGWAPDMLLRPDPERQEAEIRYVKDMNLNAIRLEGKLEDERFLELADREGILLMPGWCCCGHWEKWDNWKEEDYVVSAESLRDQVRRLRSHPSVFTWMNGSDYHPPPEVEKTYLRVLKEEGWPNPVQSSATATVSPVSGPTGVKMRGPYLFIEPSYWLTDTERGGAFGFNTETGSGAAVPSMESLRQMLLESHLWPIDEHWDYHGRSDYELQGLGVFTEAMNARYGKADDLADYVRKAQVQAYESRRAMFEAFGRNKYSSTGVIQWMLNDAWPSLVYSLYDYFLRPGGSYFGAKKGCEPLHIQYSYDDRSIVVVNSYYRSFPGLRARAVVYDLDLTERFSREATLDVTPDSSSRVFVIPDLEGLTTTYFVRLELTDSSGKALSSNFYWLSTKKEVFDWQGTGFWYTPMKSYVDLTDLERLPEVELTVATRIESQGDDEVAHVTVRNPTSILAFAVHLRITRGPDGEEVIPILWQDNFFPLMPGETREVTAAYRRKDFLERESSGLGEPEADLLAESGAGATGPKPVVAVDGWNVVPRSY